jgi:hypothetical protein
LGGPLLGWACQSPTDTSSTTTTDFIVATDRPQPHHRQRSPPGRFYTFIPSNNQPSEQREFDWRTSFTAAVTLNSPGKDVTVTFPVKITSPPIEVQQATGGIITPSTGRDTEHYEFDFSTSSNSFAAAGSTVNMNFNVWYDLLQPEAGGAGHAGPRHGRQRRPHVLEDRRRAGRAPKGPLLGLIPPARGVGRDVPLTRHVRPA